MARCLAESRRVLLVPHVGIDGDDLGSMIGLALALDRLGIETTLYSPDPVPDIYRWLPGVERLDPTPPSGGFDALVLMECPAPSRLPPGLNPRALARTVINFDHHLGNSMEADLHWVDPSWCALGEMAVTLIETLGIELDQGMAQALYVAILTDSGAFQYSHVKPRTHEALARLVALIENVEPLGRAVYCDKPLEELHLLGAVLETLETTPDGRIAWAELTTEMLARVGATEENVQNLVEDVNRVRGAEILALFKQTGLGEVRVSLRSTGPPVHETAARFGGGGHRLAAGCTLRGVSLDDARARVICALREAMSG